jgi:pimeloyl-ACP methyl ester carboxylesterase
MLLHRAIERVRSLAADDRRLKQRARRVQRTPLVIVPPMFGTRLIDTRGRKLWGFTSCIYVNWGAAPDGEVRTAGPLTEFPIVPGVVGADILGGAIRYLQRVGGYQLDRDLFVFEYDWRHGVLHGAERLAEHLAKLHVERVDLACVSSGGLVARALLLKHAERVRRVVYLGTPQRGTLQALSVLRHGMQLVPLARKYAPHEPGAVQITWDLLPHPDDEVFTERGPDLYDPHAWRELRIAPGIPDPAPFLKRAAEMHRTIDGSPKHDAVIIGATHLSTLARVVLDRGRAVLDEHCSSEVTGELPVHLGRGDGSVPETSLRGLPGGAPVLRCRPRDHRWLISDPGAQRLLLEALQAC